MISRIPLQGQEAVGFIGLGNMGAHMAKNLLNNGYPVIVFDVNKHAVQTLEEAGTVTFLIFQFA